MRFVSGSAIFSLLVERHERSPVKGETVPETCSRCGTTTELVRTTLPDDLAFCPSCGLIEWVGP